MGIDGFVGLCSAGVCDGCHVVSRLKVWCFCALVAKVEG